MYLPNTTSGCKRRYKRHTLRQPARFKFTNAGPLSGTIMDISYEGVFLKVSPTVAGLPTKSQLKNNLVIAMKVQNRVFRFVGRVIRKCSEGFGIKLLNADADKLACLVRMMRSQSRATNRGTHKTSTTPISGKRKQSTKTSSVRPPQRRATVTLSKADAAKLKQRIVGTFRRTISQQVQKTVDQMQTLILRQANKHSTNIFASTGEWIHDLTTLEQKGQQQMSAFTEAATQLLIGYVQDFSISPASLQKQTRQFSQLALVPEHELNQSVLLVSQANIAERNCNGLLLELHFRHQEMLGLEANQAFIATPAILAELFSQKLSTWGYSEATQKLLAEAFVLKCINVLPKVYDQLNQLLIDAGSPRDITKHTAWRAEMRNSVRSSFDTAKRQHQALLS